MDQDPFFRCGYDELRALTCDNGEETSGEFFPFIQPKHASGDQMLEALLHQVARQGCRLKPQLHHQNYSNNLIPFVSTPDQTLTTEMEAELGFPSENFSWGFHVPGADVQHKASPSAPPAPAEAVEVSGNNKYTEVDPSPSMAKTWDSFNSPSSFNIPTDKNDPPASEKATNLKSKAVSRSQSTYSKRRAAADAHNEAEKKRRHKINRKMEELQQLVPHARQTDKASMLDDAVNYTKQLQSLAAQLQCHQTAQMGMMSGGAVGLNPLVAGGASSSSSSFLLPAPSPLQLHPAAASQFVPLPYTYPPYNRFMAQAMNIEMYNNMEEMRRHNSSQENELINKETSQQNHGQDG